MPSHKSEPSKGRPMDDNIDDLGRKPDGTTLDQPFSDKSKRDDDKKDVEPGSDADSEDRAHRT